jgi:hypothetical protein
MIKQVTNNIIGSLSVSHRLLSFTASWQPTGDFHPQNLENSNIGG